MEHAGAPVIKRKREGLVEVSMACPERSYIELVVSADIHSVDRVIFRTLSHDQGTCFVPPGDAR